MTRAVEWAVGLATALLVVLGGWAAWAAARGRRARELRQSAAPTDPTLQARVAQQEQQELDRIAERSEERRDDVAHVVAQPTDDEVTDAATDLLARRRR